MFSWVAMLVEEGLFDVVEVFFLIVGHTHSSIDQYFSILAKLIMKCDFIGSPLALEALLAQSDEGLSLSGKPLPDGKKISSLPLGVKKLSAMFDMKTAIKPLVNTSIQYYPIPHCFRFEMFNGVCAMQYSIYSSQGILLPERPEITGIVIQLYFA